MEPKIYNPEDIKPFGGGDYESRLLLDNLMAGEKAVNVNHGTVCPGGAAEAGFFSASGWPLRGQSVKCSGP